MDTRARVAESAARPSRCSPVAIYLPSLQAISKEDLYGTLDPNTREWTDGLFTSILRR